MEKFEEKELSAILTKEDKWIVSYNPETGVASQGKTKKSALKNLKEAVELYLEEDPLSLPKREITKFKARVKIYA